MPVLCCRICWLILHVSVGLCILRQSLFLFLFHCLFCLQMSNLPLRLRLVCLRLGHWTLCSQLYRFLLCSLSSVTISGKNVSLYIMTSQTALYRNGTRKSLRGMLTAPVQKWYLFLTMSIMSCASGQKRLTVPREHYFVSSGQISCGTKFWISPVSGVNSMK